MPRDITALTTITESISNGSAAASPGGQQCAPRQSWHTSSLSPTDKFAIAHAIQAAVANQNRQPYSFQTGITEISRVLAKQKRRIKSTTTTATEKRTAAIDF
jgi:hypothetical protein